MGNTWKVLNQATGKGTKFSSIEKVSSDGGQVLERDEIAEICDDYFVSVGKKVAGQVLSTGNSLTSHIPKTEVRFKFKSIAISSVTNILKKLANNEAVGIHGIPNRILKGCYEITSVPLTEIYNYCIEHKTFPET